MPPTLHCIVTGGGLHPDGERWISARQGDLFPVKVLSKLFRGKLLASLDAAYKAGSLSLAGACQELRDPKAFARLRDQLYKTDRVAYAKEPSADPDQVLPVLGRYTHRVGISNQRLLDLSDAGVLFRTKGEATTCLPPEVFIARLLQHVLPPRFVKIRHYGLHAPANATTKLDIARRLIASAHSKAPAQAPPVTKPAAPRQVEGWRELLRRLTGIDLTRCRRCGGTLRPTSLSVPPDTEPLDTS